MSKILVINILRLNDLFPGRSSGNNFENILLDENIRILIFSLADIVAWIFVKEKIAFDWLT